MRIGVPREVKEGERRVALLPDAVERLVAAGHEVAVERAAGAAIGIDDAAYRAAGAALVDARGAWAANLVVKVKEVLAADLAHAPEGATVFGFHQLPREPERTRALAAHGVTAIAYEMLREADGTFPILAPMSRLAGRIAVEHSPRFLGRAPGRVLVLGAGRAGLAAAQAARELGAEVTVLSRSARSCEVARAEGFPARVATSEAIEKEALAADLVVGAVFIAGAPTPKLLPTSLVRRMKRGAMIADVSIDAGGVAETSRTTTHAEPVFEAEGVIHYGVPNIPAAAPAEAAGALSAAVLPYVARLGEGVTPALRRDAALRGAVLIWRGRVNHPDIAAEAGLPYTRLTDADLT